MALLDIVKEVNSLLEEWAPTNSSGGNVIPFLEKLADIVEKETETWYKIDPDPFDDRHPGRSDPNCPLGHVLKAIFKNDEFMQKLVGSYLAVGTGLFDLQCAASRLLVDLMPGLEMSIVFEGNEPVLRRLMQWAQNEQEPLKSYSVGLLGGAMEVQEIAANFKDSNAVMVPLVLMRLHQLKEQTSLNGLSGLVLPAKDSFQTPEKNQIALDRPFKDIGKNDVINGDQICDSPSQSRCKMDASSSSKIRSVPKRPGRRGSDPLNRAGECSNSSWAELEPLVIGSYEMSPLSVNMAQRLLLQYLTPMGEYQELLPHVFEHGAMDLIFHYIDLDMNPDVRLAFTALKYLASLLCHKKFATEFIQRGGLQRLLAVYRPSVAATGVSMCLYYLAYFEDAMERVCLLPKHVLNDLVSYVLWLLERSHESGRCHATMFLTMSFGFRIILELFDQQDGMRKLLNAISTLRILTSDSSDDAANLSEDEVFTSRQGARHACAAFKRYFEFHLFIKADIIHRALARSEGGSPIPETPSYKASKSGPEVIQDNIELLLECCPLRTRWDPVNHFMQLGGLQLVLRLIAMAASWNAYTGKAETIRFALDVCAICSVSARAQALFCDAVSLPENVTTPAVSILLGLAEGDILPDADVQRSALNVIINLVCMPMMRISPTIGRKAFFRRKSSHTGEDLLLCRLWDSVRANNGIMVLLKLLTIRTPITEADSVRALACRALVGVARCDTVLQIISKLPLVSSGQLQLLMREPVLQDNRAHHVRFCKHATELLERVGGKKGANMEASLEHIRRADIVSQTKIVYREKELLQLIYEHLRGQGLDNAAQALQVEANLPKQSAANPPHPCSPHLYPSQSPRLVRTLSSPATNTPTRASRGLFSPGESSSNRATKSKMAARTGGADATPRANCDSEQSCSQERTANSAAEGQTDMLVSRPSPSDSIVSRTQQSNSSVTLSQGNQLDSSLGPPGTPIGPLKLTVHSNRNNQVTTSSSQYARMQQHSKKIIRQKHELGLAPVSTILRPKSSAESAASLDHIIKEYLSKQHAGCSNPVTTCPPFSLLEPHRCPDPRQRTAAPINISARCLKKQLFPPFGGPEGRKCDRKYVHSRFRPIKSYRDSDEDGCFSCVTFSACERYLLLGTYSGELKFMDVHSAEEKGSNTCHQSPLHRIETSRDGNLVLTSSTWTPPLSALWRVTDRSLTLKTSFQDDAHVEFSHAQDRIIGTSEEKAYLYDVTTGLKLLTLYDENRVNQYSRNRATLCPTDDLALNDGVLWDVTSGKAIHKFDKFNPNISGVFHPAGLEVIINSEIWDLRTFRLLHTAPSLDQCEIRFTTAGDVIYGAIHQYDEDDTSEQEKVKSPFGSAFRTFDATDYSSIATVDVKKNIFDLCTDSSDCYLAVIENHRSDEILSEESICRLYEIGRRRDEEDQQDEDDQDDDDDEEDDDDDDEDIMASIMDSDNDDDDDLPRELDMEEDNDDDDDEAEIADSDNGDEDDDESLGSDFNDFVFELSDGSNL